ncbi:MAG: hypothetical protein L0215_03505 [Gemmataceae bacterium]|nr:hypothetical protein [Gemmataceae bacterium]
MSRTLTILFRRDPSRDRQSEAIQFEGYRPCWPDGRPVAVGLDAFCKHGQRLLGLGKRLAGCQEKLIRMLCFPLAGRGDEIHRIPGHRVRRFYIERRGTTGRVHFMDGTPTTITFEAGRDEPRVVRWIGLSDLDDGEQLWFDLAAMEVDAPVSYVTRSSRLVPCEV